MRADHNDQNRSLKVDREAGLDELRGKGAIVTGGATGIGLAIARALAGAGARVAIADLDGAGAERAAAELGGGAFGIAIDVRKRASVEQAFAAIERALGGYEILCANAGVSTMNLVADLTDEEWDFNFDVNARGVFLTNQAAVRHFLDDRRQGDHRQHRVAGREVGRALARALFGQQVRGAWASPRRWRARWRRTASASIASARAS